MHCFQLYYTLEVLITCFPNEKVQNLNLIWYYVMEKILLILVPGYTYLYIILFENTYIFIICHKKWNFSMFKKLELFGSRPYIFVINYFCLKTTKNAWSRKS